MTMIFSSKSANANQLSNLNAMSKKNKWVCQIVFNFFFLHKAIFSRFLFTLADFANIFFNVEIFLKY